MLSPPHTAILSVGGGHLSFTGEKTIRSWSQSHRRSQHSNDVGWPHGLCLLWTEGLQTSSRPWNRPALLAKQQWRQSGATAWRVGTAPRWPRGQVTQGVWETGQVPGGQGCKEFL